MRLLIGALVAPRCVLNMASFLMACKKASNISRQFIYNNIVLHKTIVIVDVTLRSCDPSYQNMNFIKATISYQNINFIKATIK